MKKNPVQKLALGTLIAVTVLVFVGAIVRVTGAGLGCPDWPTCWGELIPPWKVEQVDFDSLDVEKFQKKAEKLGRDPREITLEALRQEFNPVHTWTEFMNRLTSLPVGVLSLALVWVTLRSRQPKLVKGAALSALFLVLANAFLGAMVVASRLQSGIITTHLALAFLLIFVLVWIVWFAGEERQRISGTSRAAVLVLLLLILVEGFLGSQIREMTDSLQKELGVDSRDEWIVKIENSWLWVVHRSFSWVIFADAALCWWPSRQAGWLPKAVMGIMFAFMAMGIVFSHVEIHPVVQVLHVGLSYILVILVFYWLLAAETISEPLRARA